MLKKALLITVAFMVAACAPRTKAPVDTIFYKNGEGREVDCLVIFMPGRGDRVGDFEREGIISATQAADLQADLVATDFHIGYYYDRSVMHRLHQDVVIPARRKGYQNIWIVGISMGAMGAIFYDKNYPGMVTGILFMAPFLGEDEFINGIEQAGGVLAWDAGGDEQDDYQRDLWAWIQRYARGDVQPKVYLAYGLQDRFVLSSELLATVLPPENVLTKDGVHLWSTWLRLWEEVLARGIVCGEG